MSGRRIKVMVVIDVDEVEAPGAFELARTSTVLQLDLVWAGRLPDIIANCPSRVVGIEHSYER